MIYFCKYEIFFGICGSNGTPIIDTKKEWRLLKRVFNSTKFGFSKKIVCRSQAGLGFKSGSPYVSLEMLKMVPMQDSNVMLVISIVRVGGMWRRNSLPCTVFQPNEVQSKGCLIYLYALARYMLCYTFEHERHCYNYNSYLSHRIIDSLPRILNCGFLTRLKPVLLFFILIFMGNCLYYDTMHDFFSMTKNRF